MWPNGGIMLIPPLNRVKAYDYSYLELVFFPEGLALLVYLCIGLSHCAVVEPGGLCPAPLGTVYVPASRCPDPDVRGLSGAVCGGFPPVPYLRGGDPLLVVRRPATRYVCHGDGLRAGHRPEVPGPGRIRHAGACRRPDVGGPAGDDPDLERPRAGEVSV